MDKSPDDIKKEIHATRSRLEGTVEALAYKTDIGARTKDTIHDKMDAVKEVISNTLGFSQAKLEDVAHTAQSHLSSAAQAAQSQLDDPDSEAHMALEHIKSSVSTAGTNIQDIAANVQNTLPSMEQATRFADQAKSSIGNRVKVVQGNPLGLVVGSIAVGFLAGTLLPITTVERENIGELGDGLTESAKSKAGDLVEQGKTLVSQVVSSVNEQIDIAQSGNKPETAHPYSTS